MLYSLPGRVIRFSSTDGSSIGTGLRLATKLVSPPFVRRNWIHKVGRLTLGRGDKIEICRTIWGQIIASKKVVRIGPWG